MSTQLQRTIRGAALTLASLLLGGCTLFQPVKSVDITTYSLDVVFDPVAQETGNLTLLVNTPVASPGFNSHRMIYIKKPHEIDYFSNNQWVDNPARMLAPLITQAFDYIGYFKSVVQVRSAAKADLRLDTEIIRLQHEFLSRPSQIHLTIRAQLLDLKENKVLATREFDVTEIADSDDPYGGVMAANRAVKKILQQIVEFTVRENKALK